MPKPLSPSGAPVDKFGAGRFRHKVRLLLFTSFILTLGAAFRAGIAYVPRPRDNPAWYHSKACFYLFNFTIEITVVWLYIILRVDRMFYIPDGRVRGIGAYTAALAKLKKNSDGSSSHERERDRANLEAGVAPGERVDDVELAERWTERARQELQGGFERVERLERIRSNNSLRPAYQARASLETRGPSTELRSPTRMTRTGSGATDLNCPNPARLMRSGSARAAANPTPAEMNYNYSHHHPSYSHGHARNGSHGGGGGGGGSGGAGHYYRSHHGNGSGNHAGLVRSGSRATVFNHNEPSSPPPRAFGLTVPPQGHVRPPNFEF